MSDVAVKICGVTRPQDAMRAVELGASYVGLNFWPQSPRFVSIERGRELVAAIDGRATVVGVFVDASPEWVAEVDGALDLDLLQFHGDEGSDRIEPYGERAIKVFRLNGSFDASELENYPSVAAWLFDVHHADYGGTGKTWRYELVADLPTTRPIMVAGGIRPGRVRDVVARCHPAVIDVCSGVESSPGIKDENLMNRLFEEVADEGQIRMA
ncbi:MAG: phosphoribosylanthranilate isomerase [Thermoanaerobaculia bacterium]|nr:phosphoribosylanthranilate isomerase [Thermoanaerobaculia bacterium]